MLRRNQGIDIVKVLGGINSAKEAKELFEKKMDSTQLDRIKKFENEEILLKIANAISMCRPDAIYVNTGSKEDRQYIRAMALSKGEEKAFP